MVFSLENRYVISLTGERREVRMRLKLNLRNFLRSQLTCSQAVKEWLGLAKSTIPKVCKSLKQRFSGFPRAHFNRFSITCYLLYSTCLFWFSITFKYPVPTFLVPILGFEKAEQELKGNVKHYRPLIGQLSGVSIKTSYTEGILSWVLSCNGKWPPEKPQYQRRVE